MRTNLNLYVYEYFWAFNYFPIGAFINFRYSFFLLCRKDAPATQRCTMPAKTATNPWPDIFSPNANSSTSKRVRMACWPPTSWPPINRISCWWTLSSNPAPNCLPRRTAMTVIRRRRTKTTRIMPHRAAAAPHFLLWVHKRKPSRSVRKLDLGCDWAIDDALGNVESALIFIVWLCCLPEGSVTRSRPNMYVFKRHE